MSTPRSWDDIGPGDVLTYTKTIWSRANQQDETVTRRLRVEKVGPSRDPRCRTLEGVALTSKGTPHKALNSRPMRSGMGHVAVLALSQILDIRAGAMSKAIEHQDAAGTSGAPLGVFRNDRLIERVPAGDRTGEVTRAQAAARLGMEAGDFEILLTCPEHPQTAAVDCLVCVPVEG